MACRVGVPTSGTRPITAKDFCDGTPTVGAVATCIGPDVPPAWGPGGGGAVRWNRTWFVDQVNASADPTKRTGKWGEPCATIPEAVALAAAASVGPFGIVATILLAPGLYGDGIVIPADKFSTLNITSWCCNTGDFGQFDPEIAGNVTVTEGVTLLTTVNFTNVYVSAALIQPDLPANDLNVCFTNSVNIATISGTVVTLQLTDSVNSGDATATARMDLRCDGYSWAAMVRNAVVLTSPVLTREFFDTAADTNGGTLVANVALGAMGICDVAYPGARPGEYAIATLDDVAATDFAFGFHHTETDHVFFWLLNPAVGGRAGGVFGDSVHVVLFHNDMAAIPAPP